jgi:AraC family transcriptional regulator
MRTVPLMDALHRPGPLTLAFHANAYRGGTRHRSHSHDALHFSLVLSGRVSETVGTATEVAGALSVVAKDAGVVHADDFGPGEVRLARLTLPGGTIGELLDDPARCPGWRWSHDPRVAAPFLRLVRRANGRPATYVATDPDLVDLVAAFTARPARLASAAPPAWLAGLMDELRGAWHPSVSVSSIAQRAGVHPVYLARCVRRWFGTSLGAELRRLRLRAAAASIAEDGRTISEVAHAAGYADQPHLTREFRASVGVSPGYYRGIVTGQEYHWHRTA